ncbi:MAG: 4Fe-4S binding protein [Myxococcota bacterium]
MDLQGQNGLMGTHRESWRTRGPWAWVIGIGLMTFYCVLFFTPTMDGWAQALGLRNRWFFYAALYSVAMIGGGVYYLRRHGNSRYNRVRIGVNIGVQVVLAFALPFVMGMLGQPEVFLSYLWPLDINKLYPQTLESLPIYLAIYAVVASLVLAPLAAVLWGKRWYCSWVCGCGGLANTFGDPWRHLTSTSTRSWRFELVAVHGMLGVAVIATVAVILDAAIGDAHPWLRSTVSGGLFHLPVIGSVSVKTSYAFFVGALLAGVFGTGLYPLLGPRVWCRNFCPMAAVMGLAQKLGRFRIRVKPDMCISCGNCSAYCEMGIDVRAYAQRNESFTRASCVGCGMCAHVCPRGVLRLENGWRTQKDKHKQRLRVVDF